jgi:hypothetical protein
MIGHEQLQELVAGAALEDLDPVERQLLDTHVASCRSCRWLASELDDIVADLALAAPEIHPPVSLRHSVMDAIARSDKDSPDVIHGPRDHILAPFPSSGAAVVDPVILRGEPRQDRRITFAALGAAAVLAIAAIGSGLRTASLQDELALRQAQLDDMRAQAGRQVAAMTAAIHPAHRTASLHSEPIAATATALVIYVPGTADAYLMARDLPPTPAGRVYQLWVADHDGVVHALATFSHAGGTFVAPFGLDLDGREAAMVTLEPIGGAVGEPGPQVVFGVL